MKQTIIEERLKEIDKLNSLWEYVQELNSIVGLKAETMFELQVKISSRIAQCAISIRNLNLHPEKYK